MMLAGMALMGLSACSDDNGVTSNLTEPTATNVATSVNTLTFKWNQVDQATQYGYELTDPDGKVVVEDVTNATSVTISDLQPNTTYTLNVWAYAKAYGSVGKSKIATLTATTAATEQLAKPELTVSVASGVATVSWDAVPNAEEYEYSYVDRGETVSGTTTDTYLQLSGLSLTEHTVSVTAVSSDAAFTRSETSSITFDVTRSEVWWVKGTYTSAHLGETYKVTLVYYDDDTYSLLNWYGEDGYNFDFRVEDSVIYPLDTYNVNALGEYEIPTGRFAMPVVYISTISPNQCTFTGDSSSGEMQIVTCNYNAMRDTFVWEPSQTELWSVDGQYTSHVTGETYNCRMVAYDDNTYCIFAFYGVEDYNLKFKSNGTDFDIIEYYGYYESYGYWVNTGHAEYYGLYIWPFDGSCYIEGDQNSGSVHIYDAWDAWGYDVFTWGGAAASAKRK